MLHESGMRRLLECALPTAPPLMLPLQIMLLDDRGDGYVHRLLQQLVLLAALGVVAGEVPLRLNIVLVLGDGELQGDSARG